MICLVIVLWVVAAVLSVKLDAVWLGVPTDWRNILLALPFWPFLAFMMLTTQHECGYINKEWHY